MSYTKYSFMTDEEFLTHVDSELTLSAIEIELLKRWRTTLADQAEQVQMYEEAIRKMGECNG